MDNLQKKFLEEITALHNTIANQTTDLILTTTELSETNQKANQLNFEKKNLKSVIEATQGILQSDKKKSVQIKAIKQLYKDLAEHLPF